MEALEHHAPCDIKPRHEDCTEAGVRIDYGFCFKFTHLKSYDLFWTEQPWLAKFDMLVGQEP